MSAPKVDVLGAIDREITARDDAAIACKAAGERLDARIHAEDRDELKQARAAVVELMEDADRMAKWIMRRGQELRDHGCSECVGTGDLVVVGFRCGYHTAIARIGGAA